jgi:acyl-CoA synthetase (AMP-forming)/AMP-acid ligase II
LGYWAREEETGEAFRAHLEGTGEGPFLRTGDLGFFCRDELFVTGRIKDLIIVAGRNHYPQDIERTAENSHPALRPGCCAVFSFQVMDEERHVIAVEIDRRLSRGQIADKGNEDLEKDRGSLDSREVARAIVQSVAELHELRIDNVLLLRTGSLPKTTSGKIQRYQCRDRYLEGSLEVICEVAA